MTNLMKFDPFRDLETVTSRLSRFFDAPRADTTGERFFAPAVDVLESKEAYHFKAELPDVKKEDIKVALDNGILTLSGTKKHESEEVNEDKKYHRVERSWGTFSRSFQIPDAVQADKVLAKFENGILDVAVPKKVSEQKTTHIPIR